MNPIKKLFSRKIREELQYTAKLLEAFKDHSDATTHVIKEMGKVISDYSYLLDKLDKIKGTKKESTEKPKIEKQQENLRKDFGIMHKGLIDAMKRNVKAINALKEECQKQGIMGGGTEVAQKTTEKKPTGRGRANTIT